MDEAKDIVESLRLAQAQIAGRRDPVNAFNRIEVAIALIERLAADNARLAAEVERLRTNEIDEQGEEGFAIRVLGEAASRGETFVVESEIGRYMARINSDAMRSILERISGKPKQLTDDEACILLNEIAYDGVCDWTPDEDGHGYIQSASLRKGMGAWTARAIAAMVLREKEASTG